MSYKSRSADVLIKSGSTVTKLMLARQLPSGKRSWRRERVARDASQSEATTIEGSLVWDSWHGGDGYGYVPSAPGVQLPVTAEGNLDCRWPGQMRLPPKIVTVAGPASVFRTFTLYSSTDSTTYLYAIGLSGTDYVIWRINLATSTVPGGWPVTLGSAIGGSGEDIGDVVVFDGSAYILGNKSGLGSWKVAQNGTVTNIATWRAIVGTVTRDRFYFGGGASGLRSVAVGLDPTSSANWSADLAAGTYDASMSVTALSGRGRLLYVALTGGLNAFDTELNLVSLIPDLQGFRSLYNGRHMVEWHDAVIYPHLRGVFMHSEGVTTSIGIEQTRYNNTSLYGNITAMIPEGEWLWVLLNMPPRVYGGNERMALFAVRERRASDPGQGPLIWYQLEEWEGSPQRGDYVGSRMSIEHEIMNTYFQGARLWFDKSGSLVYINLPIANMPPQSNIYFSIINASTGFETSGEKQLPTVDMNAPLVDKYLKSVEIDLETNDAARLARVYYVIDPLDTNPTWTLLGTATANDRTEMNFPSGTTCKRVKLKVRLESNSDTVTPAVRRLALNYAELVEKNTIYTVVAQVGRNLEDADGSSTRYNPEKIVERLESYEGATVVEVTGPTGQEFNALVRSVNTEEFYNMDNEDEPYYYVTMQLVKVP